MVFTSSPVMRVNISSSGAFKRHQRADDFVHIAARAEVAAGAGDHDGLHVVGPFELVKQVAQFGVAVEGERVLALRAVQRDGADLVFHFPEEVGRLVIRQRLAVAGQQGGVDVVDGHAQVPGSLKRVTSLRRRRPQWPGRSRRRPRGRRARRRRWPPHRAAPDGPCGLACTKFGAGSASLRPVLATMSCDAGR